MFRKFRLHITFRILLILALGNAMIYILTQTHFWMITFWIGLAIIFLVSELIHFVERSHKDLKNFLLSIRQSDFSSVFPSLSNKGSNDELKQAYDEILKVFQHLRSEKEFGYQYLQTVVEHVKVALICYDEQEEVQLMNKSAYELFGKPHIKNIKTLELIDKPLLETIRGLALGRKELVKVNLQNKILHLSIQATAFKLGQNTYKLVSFQDIGTELEAQEVESWQKLIRVLTHEIMNSVIPIATLSSVVNEMLQEKAAQKPYLSSLEEDIDIRNSLQTIENRSNGLIGFVRAYSSLTQTIKPVIQRVRIKEIFTRVYTLLRPGFDKKGIKFTTLVLQGNLYIIADPELLEQVLINLLLNAMDALEGRENPVVEMTAGTNESGQTTLQIRDNGTGIDDQVLQHIFVPFFTTKKKGSGVGLSLSRQIMLLHKGNITVESTIGEGTIFRLILPE